MGAKKNKPSPLGRCVVALFFACVTVGAQQSIPIRSEFLPHITSLSARIPVPDSDPPQMMWNYPLQEYNQDVEQASRAIAQGKPAPLQFYRYTAQKGDTIITLAARFSIPQETLATANDLESADADIVGMELIVPTAPGLFMAKQPVSTLEIFVTQEHAAALSDSPSLPAYKIGGRDYVFLQGARLSQTARAFFLDTSLRMPLKDYVLTSEFGYRDSPISGKWLHHNGVDLAAPIGTPVYACKSGTVQTILTNDAIYGNCITLQHTNGLTSVYAHLSSVGVKTGQKIKGGTKIGAVGTTGASTGPHLHFEVRKDGRPQDPMRK